MNDTLLDAPGNTWVALRVINETHNLILTEYRGRNDPPTTDYANFTSLFDLNADPYQLTNLMATATANAEGAKEKGASGGVEVERETVREAELELELGFDVGALRTQMYVLANCTGDDCFAQGE